MKNFYNKYLADLQKNIYENDIVISIGNESCDIDSFISSIVIAIIRKTVWVVNISHEIFKYKEEIMYLTKYLGIPINEIIFYEARENKFVMNNKQLNFENKNIRVVIVDHNITNIEFPNIVVELIIDHHKLFENVLNEDKDNENEDLEIHNKNSLIDDKNSADSIIKKYMFKKLNDCRISLINHSVGSCTTLVSKYFLKKEYVKCKKLRKKLAKLLMIGISIDTKNLKKRVDTYDIEEFKKLSKISGCKGKKINKLRKKLKQKISDKNNLKTKIILSKDFKKYKIGLISYGYSTVRYSFKKWVDRNEESLKNEEIEKFNKYQNLEFLFINYKIKNKRFLHISERFEEKFKQKLIEKYNFISKRYKTFDYFEIPVKMSRKVMVPEIYKLFNNIE